MAYDMAVLNDLGVDDYFDNVNNLNNINMIHFVEEVENPKRKYKVQKRIDPFEIYDEDEFKARYRLSKELVWKLYNLIDGPITLEPQVSRANYIHKNLRFIADIFLFNIHRPNVSQAILLFQA